MNRRNFLSLIAAAPLVAAVPVLAKAIPTNQRQHFAGEVVHLYAPIIVRDGFFMNNCLVYCHGTTALVIPKETQHYQISYNRFRFDEEAFSMVELLQ